MKIKLLLVLFLILIGGYVFGQTETYYVQRTLLDSLYNDDTVLVIQVDTIRLNGDYEYVELAIRDTTNTPTLTAKVNYSNDSIFYPAYVTTNFNTTAVSLALAPAENTQYQFCDKAIRRIILYLTGSADATLTYELKARKYK